MRKPKTVIANKIKINDILDGDLRKVISVVKDKHMDRVIVWFRESKTKPNSNKREFTYNQKVNVLRK